jgi:uncharacterized membrane protein YhaH (DUF805 family)
MKFRFREPSVWWALFSYRGRLGRKSYFLGGLLMLVVHIYIILNLVQVDRNNREMMAVWGFVLIGFWFVSLLAVLALTVKRLHDLNLSGAWAILLFIPAVTVIFVVFIMLKPGSRQNNAHGPPPFANN